MKKLLLIIGILIVSITTNAQIIANQSISAGPYKVGDTVTVLHLGRML